MVQFIELAELPLCVLGVLSTTNVRRILVVFLWDLWDRVKVGGVISYTDLKIAEE